MLDLAMGLVSRGHEVCLAYSPVRAEAGFLQRLRGLPGVTVMPVVMHREVSVEDFSAYSGLWRLAVEQGPFDILHSHSSKAGALLRSIPVPGARVYTPHAFRTMDPHTPPLAALVFGGVETLLARVATDCVIAVSAEEARHARTRLRVPASKLATIVNGVSSPGLRPRALVRSELGIDASDVLVGFVGRLCYQKYPELFLEAISRARKINPAIKGLMLGDGELFGAVEELCISLGLEEAVKLVRGQSAMDYFGGMDCLCMTSRYEAMPYVLLEALSVGLPIVSTRVGGTDEAVVPGVTGFLVESEAEAVAEAVLDLAGDALLRRRLSMGAVERAAAYTTESMVAKTEEVYLKSIGSKMVLSASSRPAA
ncbi:glycosyltransferase family 4 protein [Caulobacter sp. 17J65-9]|nr:glycosyltransferase family 4 protein [Caulobacter sp. 17J65-9]